MHGQPVSVSYRRDDAARRIRISANPPFTKDDAINAVYRQAAEGAWHYGALVDLRRGILDSQALGELILHIRDLVVLHGVRGPVALVTWESAATELVRTFADDARLFVNDVGVFQNTHDAERWLDERLSPPQTSGPDASG